MHLCLIILPNYKHYLSLFQDVDSEVFIVNTVPHESTSQKLAVCYLTTVQSFYSLACFYYYYSVSWYYLPQVSAIDYFFHFVSTHLYKYAVFYTKQATGCLIIIINSSTIIQQCRIHPFPPVLAPFV